MKELLNSILINKSLKRITHEIIEKNDDLNDVVFVGIKRKGVFICNKIVENILLIENINVSKEEIDITGYRDDKNEKSNNNNFSVDINNKVVILFDDVLQTGRTVRCAMDALVDIGRPKKIQLAVLVDRGHRELPIRPDYVGKNIPTNQTDDILFDNVEEILYLK